MARCCWCGGPLGTAQGAWWCADQESCRKRQRVYAVSVRGRTGVQWLYVPTPKQTVWHESVYDPDTKKMCVGGAAGPGKSRWLRETLYGLAMTIPGFHGLLLRRSYKDLDQSHLRFMPHEVSQRGGQYKVGERVAVFRPTKGGPESIIRAGHMETDGDVYNYLSSEYDVIAPDELVTFERDPMLELFSRARTTNPAMRAIGGAKVLAPTNPGGRGGMWVKEFFIDKTPDPEAFPFYRPEEWSFFDAKLDDNPYMDPAYRRTLEDLPEMRRRQLLDGDWHAYEGQFFGEFRVERHEAPWHVRTLPLAKDLEFFASMDWGYNAPGVVLWWACLPDGRYHILKEYKFQHSAAEAVGAAIRRINTEIGIERLRYISADPSMWQKTGAGRGESIAETLLRLRLPMRKSDNDRFNGWTRVHEFLRDKTDTEPWLTMDVECRYLIRTIPAQMQSKHDPDDVDTTKDDHAVDALRYGAMSRPSPTRVRVDRAPKVNTIGWWRRVQRRNEQSTGALA